MGFVESFDALLDPKRRELGLNPFELAHGLHEGFSGLLFEEHPRRRRGHACIQWRKPSYRFGSTTAAVSDHRPAERHCLHRHHSEIFLTGKNQCSTMRVLFAQLTVGKRAAKGNRGASETAQRLILFAFANDVEAVAKPVASLDRNIRALVIDKLAGKQVIIFDSTGKVTCVDAYRRVNDGGFTAVVLADARLDRP